MARARGVGALVRGGTQVGRDPQDARVRDQGAANAGRAAHLRQLAHAAWAYGVHGEEEGVRGIYQHG